jgi:pseudouridine synthase
MSERIQKILRDWGIASRREAEKMIIAERVTVNGRVCNLGDKADPNQDKIVIDNQELTNRYRPKLVYLLINKPKDYLCTCDDPKNRKTVLDLLPEKLQKGMGIHPVGRLDRNSTGALILTNDGALTMALTHPRYHLPKTYLVTLKGKVDDEKLQQWAKGLMLEGKQTLPADIILNERSSRQTKIKIILEEGRNRQIRKIGELLGHPVTTLHRQAIASLQVSSLPLGKYRFLTQEEVTMLKKSTSQEEKPSDKPNRQIRRKYLNLKR